MSDSQTSNTTNLGMPAEYANAAAELLSTLLADEYMLYTKLRKYHWNVTGPYFFSLHAAFQAQYEAVDLVIDEVAERVRQYGAVAPGTLEEFKARSRLQEQPGQNPDAMTMVINAATDHESIVRALRQDLERADEWDDEALESYLTDLMDQHTKFAWMLRATASA